jgi:hypothetical protein
MYKPQASAADMMAASKDQAAKIGALRARNDSGSVDPPLAGPRTPRAGPAAEGAGGGGGKDLEPGGDVPAIPGLPSAPSK